MDLGGRQAWKLFAMVIGRRIVMAVVVLTLIAIAYFAASNVMVIHRSGGCNHIPLTAAGQPAYQCSSHP